LTGAQFHHLARCLFELLETVKREFERNREVAKASLITASSILQSEIERNRWACGARSGPLTRWQILRMRSFIDRNLHRAIYTRDLAAVAQRSRAHFARSFKQTFGEPPHAYVTRMRLHRACHLMVTTPATIVEISLAMGFSDQSHLCRLFRKTFGQSPSRWRREFEIQKKFDVMEWETLDKQRRQNSELWPDDPGVAQGEFRPRLSRSPEVPSPGNGCPCRKLNLTGS
jgi:AraC family transcriptional regulator